MRRSAISGPFWLSALLVAADGARRLHGPATYGTGEAPEMAMFREMTGGILDKNEKKEPIEYQPRAPLVMPPAAGQLPAPAAARRCETASAGRSPNWPMDPDGGRAGGRRRRPGNDINQAEYRRLKPLAGVFPNQRAGRPTSVDDERQDDYYNTIVHGQRAARQTSPGGRRSEGL